ncbi:O-methyltransferase [Amycolatopsis sulphurea]|uniref:O-methyltransferase n=1 Tax=Amycolatopsis sulphurea TaxID=76022 RepID=A0A2A9F626_9PSEU|nr:methyltransferase [Amycolatopsis sulphurea]PFG46423.1 O-methyltransferase [Amycolatopsis sulphurea]
MRSSIFVSEQDFATLRELAGLATPMALRVAVTLGLPDRLRGDGADIEQIAAELGVSPVALELLLGHLGTLGVVDHGPGGYRTTAYGAALCADAGNGLANLLDLTTAGGRAELALTELLHSVTTGEAGYPRLYGQDFWADLAAQPRLRESFDRQMTYRFRDQVSQIAAGHDWGRYSGIVDVGGGRGTLLAAILLAHPTVRGHLIDLAPTAAAAERTFHGHALGDRARVTAGSFFDPLPAGADAYLLSDILHDWDDEHAHRILARCAEAATATATATGRILIIEPVGGRRGETAMDLAMLTIFGSRERRVDEFRTLAAAHRLILDQVTDLSDQRCLLEFRLTDH